MGKVVILADSTCDLSGEFLTSRNIKIIPLKVCFGEDIYKDGLELNPTELYERVATNGTLPKTSAPTIDEFKNFFKKEVDEGNDVVSISISSDMSSAYQQSLMAARDLGEPYESHIQCVDSRNLSTGIGLLVLKACDARDEGKDAKEIKDMLDSMTNKIRAQFSVKELEYLHKGGRCSGTSKFFGTLLRIHPILRVIGGKIILAEKVFGRYGQALELQIKDLVDNLKDVDPTYLFVTHSGCEDLAKYIMENLPDKVKGFFKNIYVNVAGCVISSHCGPNTIGVLYIKNNEVK